MSPVAFELGPFAVRWYGILVALAFISGIYITNFYGHRYDLDPGKLEALILRMMFVIIIGARLGYVVTRWDFFMQNPRYIPRIDLGGLGSHGAILLALVFGFWWTRKLSLSFWTTGDAIAPAIPLAHVFVRIGNFMNAELFGPPTDLPWGVVFPGTEVPHHPSQLYEALTSLLIFILLLKAASRRKYPGQILLLGLFTLSGARFFIDFFRQTTRLYGPFVLTQLISLFIAVITGVLLWYRRNAAFED